jgi:hypothetical protein
MNIKTLITTSFVALMVIAPVAQAAHAAAPSAPASKLVLADRTRGDCFGVFGDIVDTANQAGQVLQNWQNAPTLSEKKYWMRKYDSLKLKYWKLINIYANDCLDTYPGLPTDVPAFPTTSLS